MAPESRFFDRVHGPLQLSGMAALIAEHRAIAYRLDGLRQLGGCFFVYPSATHTRREHSLGVAFLAAEMARHLQLVHGNVDEADIVCLEIAGLMHDAGHGPLSHLFEEYMQETKPGWSHEDMSIALIDVVASAYLSAEDVTFIKLLVGGISAADAWPSGTGRGEDKRFLTEIVHNQDNGIDVDKLDYLARDYLAVFGGHHCIDSRRIIQASRVRHVNDIPTIVFEERVSEAIAEVFALRSRMHLKVYQHRSVLVAEGLLKDLMRAIDATREPGERLSDSCDSVERFLQLTDASVIHSGYGLDEWNRLFRRPWFRRLPLAACLRTLPSCVACGAATKFDARVCSECGTDTASRAGIAVDGTLVPPECMITGQQVSEHLNKVLSRTDARVYLVDVCGGARVDVRDFAGRKWRDFDPVAKVHFFWPDGRLVHMKSISAPERRHVRMAYAYLSFDASDDDVAHATAAFREWAVTVGDVVEG